MNRWRCQVNGCGNSCVGVGGAVGLRAIGWYFKAGGVMDYVAGFSGPEIFCPQHRPDKKQQHACYQDCDLKDCSLCLAQEKASHWQWLIEITEGLD